MNMRNLSFRMIGVIFAASVLGAAIFIAPKTIAQSTTSAFSGVCAGIFNVANPYEVAMRQTGGTIDTEGLNASVQLDLTNNKAYIVVNQGTFNRNSDAVTYRVEAISNRAITLTDFPQMPGAKKGVVVTPELGGNTEFLLIPVNSGNTILIQGLNFGASGVCQKV
jgi:hypothetical protein